MFSVVVFKVTRMPRVIDTDETPEGAIQKADAHYETLKKLARVGYALGPTAVFVVPADAVVDNESIDVTKKRWVAGSL